MSTYAGADTRAQWYQDDYPGSDLRLTGATMVEVLHTTEGTDWPSYSGGAVAPNATAKPDMKAKALRWRAHFPDEKSSRALVNKAGGVQTNTLNAHQVELVGTCDPRHRVSWGRLRAGRDYVYWPEAPDWAVEGLAQFLADMHRRHGLRLEAPLKFKSYPSSYGANGVRMSFEQWRRFAGVCGHQHVPENVHGDPGDLPVERALARARQLVAPGQPTKPAPVAAPQRGGTVFDVVLEANNVMSLPLNRKPLETIEAGGTASVRMLQEVDGKGIKAAAERVPHFAMVPIPDGNTFAAGIIYDERVWELKAHRYVKQYDGVSKVSLTRHICVAELRHRKTGRIVAFMSFHDVTAGGDRVRRRLRRESRAALRREIRRYKRMGIPVAVGGDWNDRGNPHPTASAHFQHGIDHVYCWSGKGWRWKRKRQRAVGTPSDHDALVARATVTVS